MIDPDLDRRIRNLERIVEELDKELRRVKKEISYLDRK